ncbi:MAG: rhodanese-like domain-containing protein [Sphingobacteriia bacterium]|nr:rhodanese-like domain-containing protein [Sphingobacteriia bacterium]NCC40735.1 rhodanese-like domain-containing protein [Gammaproteobacteria bacterium]
MTLTLMAATTPLHGADPSESLFDLEDLRVKLTESLSHLEIKHEGRSVLLMRHQDPDHGIVAPYDLTARDCPPFCIQPMQLAPGVETIGELELIQYLQRAQQGEPVLIIDSRTGADIERGMIPGAVNIPYTKLDPAHADPAAVAELLELELGAMRDESLWNFSHAKTLVFYCNGPWCGQSPTNIRALLALGYPPDRIKWYRGGMQVWEQFGLTTVRPAGDED